MELIEVVGQRFSEAVFRCLSNKKIKSTTEYSGKCHLHAGARIGFNLMLLLNDSTARAAKYNKASVTRFISLQIVTRGRNISSYINAFQQETVRSSGALQQFACAVPEPSNKGGTIRT